MNGARRLLERAGRKLADREASDFLSPILVKETRQGVRGNAFTGALLLLQGLMALSLLGALLAGTGGSPEVATALFWSAVAIPSLVVLPLSGLRALSSERELRTLEPILLTRLEARAIVSGKWAALAAQILLLFASVLPFVLLRHFLGGIDVSAELWVMLELLLCSTLITALAVCVSASRLSGLFRVLVVFGVGVPLYTMIQAVIGGHVSLLAAPLLPVAAVAALWLLSVQLLHSLGAGALAPRGESRSASVRVLALAAAPIAIWAASLSEGGHSEVHAPLALWGVLLLLTASVAGVVEDRREHATLDAPLLGGSRLRAAAGSFLAPGWPSGVAFALLVLAAACTSALWLGAETPDVAIWGLALLAALVQPVTLTQWLAPRTRRRGTLYVIFVIAALGASLASSLFDLLAPDELGWVGKLIGALSPLGYAAQHEPLWPLDPSRGEHLAAAVVVALSVGAAGFHAGRALLERRRLLRAEDRGRPEGALGGAAEA